MWSLVAALQLSSRLCVPSFNFARNTVKYVNEKQNSYLRQCSTTKHGDGWGHNRPLGKQHVTVTIQEVSHFHVTLRLCSLTPLQHAYNVAHFASQHTHESCSNYQIWSTITTPTLIYGNFHNFLSGNEAL